MRLLAFILLSIILSPLQAQIAQLPNAIPIAVDGDSIVDLEINQPIQLQYCNSAGTQCLFPFSPSTLPILVTPSSRLFGASNWTGVGKLYAIKGPHFYNVDVKDGKTGKTNKIKIDSVTSARHL